MVNDYGGRVGPEGLRRVGDGAGALPPRFESGCIGIIFWFLCCNCKRSGGGLGTDSGEWWSDGGER